MFWIEDEICPAVLESEAAVFWDNGGTETAEVAVYEGGAVAVGVGHGEINCVTVVVRG